MEKDDFILGLLDGGAMWIRVFSWSLLRFSCNLTGAVIVSPGKKAWCFFDGQRVRGIDVCLINGATICIYICVKIADGCVFICFSPFFREGWLGFPPLFGRFPSRSWRQICCRLGRWKFWKPKKYPRKPNPMSQGLKVWLRSDFSSILLIINQLFRLHF